LNTKPLAKELLLQTPVRDFVQMDKATTFVKMKPCPYLIMYRFNSIEGPLSVNNEVKLPLGRMYHFYTESVHFGYLFELPCHRIVQGLGYFGISRVDEDHLYEDVIPVMVNAHLTIVASNRDALLIMRPDHKLYVDRAGYHRKREE
jgi:hypothetical protein